MNKILTKANRSLNKVSSDLREALNEATTVESLILLPLIKRVNEVRNELAELRAAREEDEDEKKS